MAKVAAVVPHKVVPKPVLSKVPVPVKLVLVP